MTKVMLVEDDRALSEIYGIRLVAEGYEVVQAIDGEDGLAKIVQEKPDLVIADIMMPKISGFDMMDIIRSTPEVKDTKIIVMTALSADSQRERGEALGADRYLVKSQVGIEDVINAVHEVMGDKPSGAPVPEGGEEDVELTQDVLDEVDSQTDGLPETDSFQPAGYDRGSLPPVPPRQ